MSFEPCLFQGYHSESLFQGNHSVYLNVLGSTLESHLLLITGMLYSWLHLSLSTSKCLISAYCSLRPALRSRLSLSPPSLDFNSSPPLAAAVQAHLLVVGHLAAAVVLGLTGVTVLVDVFPHETENDFTLENRQHTNTHRSHASRTTQSSRFYKHPDQNLFTERQLI